MFDACIVSPSIGICDTPIVIAVSEQIIIVSKNTSVTPVIPSSTG